MKLLTTPEASQPFCEQFVSSFGLQDTCDVYVRPALRWLDSPPVTSHLCDEVPSQSLTPSRVDRPVDLMSHLWEGHPRAVELRAAPGPAPGPASACDSAVVNSKPTGFHPRSLTQWKGSQRADCRPCFSSASFKMHVFTHSLNIN